MKKYVMIIVCFVVSFYSYGFEIRSYNNIQVNPVNARDYRVVTSIHVKWLAGPIATEDDIVAREAIAVALKSLKLREFTGHDAIDTAKRRILALLIENERLGSDKIAELFITDLVVEYTGESKAYIRGGGK